MVDISTIASIPMFQGGMLYWFGFGGGPLRIGRCICYVGRFDHHHVLENWCCVFCFIALLVIDHLDEFNVVRFYLTYRAGMYHPRAESQGIGLPIDVWYCKFLRWYQVQYFTGVTMPSETWVRIRSRSWELESRTRANRK